MWLVLVICDTRVWFHLYFSNESQYPPIAGLYNHELDFLGLLNCAYNACHRENLPAVQV